MEKSENVAVIATGGKQYCVREGDRISIELLDADPGKEVKFVDVLLLHKGDKTEVGAPTVTGASVTGKVLEKFKGEKVIVFKKKKRKGYKRKQGHRQNLLMVEIESIDAKPAAAPKRAPTKAKAAPRKTTEKVKAAPKKAAPNAKASPKKSAPKKASTKAAEKPKKSEAKVKTAARKSAAKKSSDGKKSK